MIALFLAAAAAAQSTANATSINTLGGASSVVSSQSQRSTARAWVPPDLAYDEDALCVPMFEKQIDGFGTLRIGRPCSMRRMPASSSAFSNDNGERGMQ